MELIVACSCGLSFPCGVPGFLVTWGERKDVQEKGLKCRKVNNQSTSWKEWKKQNE
jgi:hypothetical protein